MGISNKFKRVYELFSEGGFSGVKNQTAAYIRNHTTEKWRYIYLELDLTSNPYSLPAMDDSMLVRRGKPEDLEKIKTDLYPYMEEKQEYDKRHMECLEEEGIDCFIAEKKGKFVSYFMVFKNAAQSPLTDTPFDKKMIAGTDAYLGNAFTIPNVRGMWIVPHVMLSIINYLQNESSALRRALLLVHEDTPGAVGFFRRLGFKVIENAAPMGFFSKILRK